MYESIKEVNEKDLDAKSALSSSYNYASSQSKSNNKNSRSFKKLPSLKESLNSASLTQSNSNISQDKQHNHHHHHHKNSNTKSNNPATNLVKYAKSAAPSEDWEITARDSWWYSTLKNTPSPLKYNYSTFVDDIFKRPNTYQFKNNGRQKDPVVRVPKGCYLLPGAYNYEDLSDRVKKMRMSYGFKNTYPLGKQDIIKPATNPNVGPGTYDLTQYLALDPIRENIKHSFFKSKEKRKIFDPKEGPPPGQYDSKNEKTLEISSSFVSDTDRFKKESDSKNPGPGSYEPINVWIESKQSREFSEKGVFFTPSAKIFK